MTSFDQIRRAGDFLLSEKSNFPGDTNSRDIVTLAQYADRILPAGTVLEMDGNEAIPYAGGTACGVLFAATDVRDGAVIGHIVARSAEVMQPLLWLPDDGDMDAAIASLAMLGIIVRGQPADAESPSSYIGPLDLVPSAVVAYGQRALSAAMLGQPLYTIRRVSDDATQQFASDATSGVAPASDIESFLGAPLVRVVQLEADSQTITVDNVAGIAAFQLVTGTGIPAGAMVLSINEGLSTAFLNVTIPGTVADVDATFQPAGTVAVWSDQSGNASDVLQATAANQPIWILAGPNGRPIINFEADYPHLLNTAGNISLSNGECSVFIVAYPATARDATSNFFGINGASSDYMMLYYTGGSPPLISAEYFNGSNGAGGNYIEPANFKNAFMLLDTNIKFGASDLFVNGTEITQDFSDDFGSGPGAVTDRLSVGNVDAEEFISADALTGGICELIIYPTALADPDRALLRANMAAYYGITLA